MSWTLHEQDALAEVMLPLESRAVSEIGYIDVEGSSPMGYWAHDLARVVLFLRGEGWTVEPPGDGDDQ